MPPSAAAIGRRAAQPERSGAGGSRLRPSTRGDVVTVQDLTFDGNQGQPPVAVSEQILNDVDSSAMLVKYAALLLGLFVRGSSPLRGD